MADKKLSFSDIIFLVILCGLLMIFGCASPRTNKEDSTHYVAQAHLQGYPCPGCGFSIPIENISANIRTKNECPNCGKIFFGTPEITTEEESEPQQGKPYQGPKVFGRGYYSDITYKNKFDRSGKSTWKVSPDGNSGSMSQTSIRTYEHTTDGEHGTLVGPGANYGYGYGGY